MEEWIISNSANILKNKKTLINNSDISPKGLRSDPNFEINFAMKSDTDLPPVCCEHIASNLYLEQGRVEFHFVKEEYDLWTGIILKDKILTGADNELSFLSTDFFQMKLELLTLSRQ